MEAAISEGFVNSSERAKKLKEALFEYDVETSIAKKRDTEIKSSQAIIMEAAISEGFQYRDIKFTVITDKEMIGVQRSGLKSKKKKKKNTNAQKIDSFLDLNPGDYVVHENSGIGRYTGIDQITVDGKSKKKKKKNTNAQKIDSFLDLNPGDYVVHENSGIGRYTGIDQITVDGTNKD